MTESTETVRVFIVEDDKDFIFLIEKMLERQPEITVIGSCSKKEDAVKMVCALQPQIVIMDLNLGTSEADGIRISREIRLLTDAKVLILTSLDSPEIVLKAAKEAFASGYIFKNQPNLLVENILALAKGYTAQEYLIASMAILRTDGSGDGRLSTADGQKYPAPVLAKDHRQPEDQNTP